LIDNIYDRFDYGGLARVSLILCLPINLRYVYIRYANYKNYGNILLLNNLLYTISCNLLLYPPRNNIELSIFIVYNIN